MKRVIRGWGVVSAVVLLAFLIVGCQADRDRNGNGNGDGLQAFNTEKQEYRQNLEDTRNQIDQKISELRSDLNEASEEGKQEINDQIDKLNDHRSNLNDRISRLDNVTEDNWEQFKSDTDDVMNDIKQGFQEMESEVKEQVR